MTIRTLIAIVATALVLTGPALAAPNSPAYLRVANRAMGLTQEVQIEVNKSMLVDLPTNAGEVIVSQPNVATAVMRTKTRAIIQGVAGGTTNIFFLDGAGNSIAVLDLKVVQPASEVGVALEATLARVLKGSNIRVESLTDNAIDGKTHFLLTGTVQTPEDKALAEQMATELSETGEKTGSLITVIGPQQVMLQVTVAEVNRAVAKELGIDLSMTTSGGLITGLVNKPNADALGGASGISTGQGTVTGSATIGPATFSATLKALARRDAVRTLAQPTLTAISGQQADFLAGGQRAYSISDGNGGSTVAYKDYGVKLSFTPTIRRGGIVGLQVSTEVSTPIGTSDFNVRSAKTSVDVPIGGTLAIGGIFQDDVKQRISSMPGLGDIPVLGALFRSRDFIRNQTELMIIVTPVIADLGRPELPTDNMHMSGDAEAIFLGHLEKMYGVEGDGMRGSYTGSVGFVLD
ncbi:MAG: type II and III secretion system protein family protein [Devosia sp.]